LRSRHSGLMKWVAAAVDFALAIVVLMKTYSYLREGVWFARFGRSQLLPQYKIDPERTYEKDALVGRPRSVSWRFATSPAGPMHVLGVLFKTPTLVAAVSVVSMIFARWSPEVVAVGFALCLVLLVVTALLTAVTLRLVLGPYDALNPDLRLPRLIRTHIYNDGKSIGIYVLALLFVTVVGFTAVYANVGGAIAGAFTEQQSVDPIRWLYFTLTGAATVGYGDVHAQSDFARSLVILQMGAGSLVLAWALAAFFGEGPSNDSNSQPDSLA
jgi:hypothetical protein